MPAYIAEPTLSQGPVSGQANQSQVTIPGITPSVPFYSFGRLAGYNDAPTQNTEFGETMAVGKGRQCSLRAFAGLNQNSPAIAYEVSWTGSPTSFSIQLEGAYIDLDSDYAIIGSAITQAGTSPTKATINLGSERWNFLRFNITAVTGGTTIIAKIIM